MLEENHEIELDYDFLIPILLIGDANTGKTSLMTRYTDDTFNSAMYPSVGVDFKYKKIVMDNKRIKIQIVSEIH